MILPATRRGDAFDPVLTLACAQLNLCAGDIANNCAKILQAARDAYTQGARLLLTPELAISAYASEDLFLRPGFMAACVVALTQLALDLKALPGMVVVVGHPSGQGVRGPTLSTNARYNTASVLQDGKVLASYHKRCLPNYQNFDENRYFVAGQVPCVLDIRGVRAGILICEDAWFDAPAAESVGLGAQVLLIINASPYHVHKRLERLVHMQKLAQQHKVALVYAHLVGGQDEFVYDGASFALNAQGRLQASAPAFTESLLMLQVSAAGAAQALPVLGVEAQPDSGLQAGLAHLAFSGFTLQECTQEDAQQGLSIAAAHADLWQALVLGLHDYVEKNDFPGVLLGLSGGIDSAVVLALAVDAFGPDRVRAVLMPSPYTADISIQDARMMAVQLGVQLDELSIAAPFLLLKESLAPIFARYAEDTTEENLQARIRGVLLMAMSNKLGYMLLSTGNKSEVAVGYATLYGDMCGGFGPIKDVLKTTVFALAHWRNAHDPFVRGQCPIPERIITRPPSAELRPEQTDQDSLPTYDILDAIIERHVEGDQGFAEIVRAGFDDQIVGRVLKLIKISEHKRCQSAPGTRISPRSFGKDWRFPISNHCPITDHFLS